MFNQTPDDLDMHLVYDVSHNIAKVEEHVVDGRMMRLLVHRKVGGLWLRVLQCSYLAICQLGEKWWTAA